MDPGVSTPLAVFATRPGLLFQCAGDLFFSRVAIVYPLSCRADSKALIPTIVSVTKCPIGITNMRYGHQGGLVVVPLGPGREDLWSSATLYADHVTGHFLQVTDVVQRPFESLSRLLA